MVKKIVFLSLVLCIFLDVFAQKGAKPADISAGDVVLINPAPDSIKARDRSSQILRNLQHGCIIVRLKKNQKSVDAYRKSGQTNIADRLEADRKKQNLNIYSSFTDFFTFCKVYFIYASETQEFLNGNKKIFLNASLEHDPSINFTDTFYIFCEYGDAQPSIGPAKKGSAVTGGANGSFPVVTNNTRLFDSTPVQNTTDVSTYSSLVLYDKDLRQMERPFPYATGVYLDNFGASVRTLEREIERTYFRLVLNRDLKESVKKMRKQINREK